MAKPLHWDVHGQLYILAVDDDHVNLMVVEQLLGSEGHKVASATDGAEAMGVLEDGPTWPDAIFLDYYLRDGETGDQVCERMRELFDGVPVPIILCTALSDGTPAIQQALQAGATDYLLKPYEKNKLIDKIRKHAPEKVSPSPQEAPAVQPASTQPIARPATPPATEAPLAEPKAVSGPSVLDFCKDLDLEYCGMKLMDAGLSMTDLKAMDDSRLRKAGVVVKSQRDKIISALAAK